MFKAHIGTHMATWFHWISQGIESCAKGGKGDFTGDRSTHREKKGKGGERFSPEREGDERRSRVVGGSPERRGGHRRRGEDRQRQRVDAGRGEK
jgi:hypothetical protein